MNDTPPEVNSMLFAAMIRKSPEERLVMGFDMLATAREMVRSAIGPNGTEEERRAKFFERFYGTEADAIRRNTGIGSAV